MIPKVTMLELVHVVREFADTDAEIIAAVIDMVNGGMVELAGNFRGRTFELHDFAALA